MVESGLHVQVFSLRFPTLLYAWTFSLKCWAKKKKKAQSGANLLSWGPAYDGRREAGWTEEEDDKGFSASEEFACGSCYYLLAQCKMKMLSPFFMLSRISRQQQQSIKLRVRAFCAGAPYACTGRPAMKPAPSAWKRCLFSPAPSHPSFHVQSYKNDTLKLASDASEP